jgi:hypothetical protein
MVRALRYTIDIYGQESETHIWIPLKFETILNAGLKIERSLRTACVVSKMTSSVVGIGISADKTLRTGSTSVYIHLGR